MRVQPAGAPSLRSFRMLHLYRCQQGSPLLPAGYHGISPVEIYKPSCGAIEVAPQGGFIVRMGGYSDRGRDEDGAISDKKPSP